MTNLLQAAFAVVSQLPEAELNAMATPAAGIAQLILQQLAQRHQSLHQIPIDFMQFAGIASAAETIVLLNSTGNNLRSDNLSSSNEV